MAKEDWSKITDANMEHTKSVTFQTEGGKCVEFVKVVRCKDCKHWDINTVCQNCNKVGCWTKAEYECLAARDSWNDIYRYTAADWFCADGERKNENETTEN